MLFVDIEIQNHNNFNIDHGKFYMSKLQKNMFKFLFDEMMGYVEKATFITGFLDDDGSAKIVVMSVFRTYSETSNDIHPLISIV